MLLPPFLVVLALLFILAILAYPHIQPGTALSFGAMDVAVRVHH